MPYVRTSFQPGEVRKVDEGEFLDLDRQGLILEVVHPHVGPPAMENVPLTTVSTSDTVSKPSTK